jgi:1,4-alpha-glucan branching enzyme
MKKTALLFMLITAVICTGFSQTAIKEYESPEITYQRLAKENDYWINSPLMMNDAIVFFFKEKASKVLVAGDFNNWKPELLMEQKGTNFFQVDWNKRLSKGVYKYKLMVDDIWMNDPYNTNTVIDDSGQMVSYFELKEDFIPNAKYPLWDKKDVYVFKYDNEKAKAVYLVGDFNNWNPYSNPMEPLGGGEFKVKVRLKPGMHSYCYVVDGDWKADPNNLNQFSDEVGNIISIMFVKD